MNILQDNDQYKKWLIDLKRKLRSVQLKVALSVNRELLRFYWELGADIVQKQAASNWGDGFLNQLSNDLRAEFPEVKGFSRRNVMPQFFLKGPRTCPTQPRGDKFSPEGAGVGATRLMAMGSSGARSFRRDRKEKLRQYDEIWSRSGNGFAFGISQI